MGEQAGKRGGQASRDQWCGQAKRGGWVSWEERWAVQRDQRWGGQAGEPGRERWAGEPGREVGR